MTTLAPPLRPRPRYAPVRHLGPHWYATVMGTAIVGTAGTAPAPGLTWIPGFRAACGAVWALAFALLLAVGTARALHWIRLRDRALAELRDPAVAPFQGCAAMALVAVGGGALTAGRELLGPAAVALGTVLWTAGTALGLLVAVGIPYLMVARRLVAGQPGAGTGAGGSAGAGTGGSAGTGAGAGPGPGASPVWLLPVVAPMVSAASGPLLAQRLPAGQPREALLLFCCALFGLSLLATLLMLPLIFGRLVSGEPLPLPSTPTLFLVLGPLGQSTTAAAAFAGAAPGVPGARELAVAYGVPVTGFALMWLALASAVVVRSLRRGLGFSMTWWAFTFPVGTCVTGTAGLARLTGLPALGWLAAGLYALLLAAWATAAVRTVRGLAGGGLLAAPREPRPATARTR
ncbi:C4-dicarboxylate ABC transporter [Streptomyces sp. LP05-1]|uniref:C4-dicarboxylate ABC transporter n=1 Tax=Streptomyces pyxinae TaxID=2970734 RepID=A0ABT2CHR3_9ACTN|nr:C4-dicarboxylate ABC transporter [Streptomyces sp. LP05-1]MCS0636154.1 C4-dicarboxylate ABC transporter [Streptomyces sp. LP05-1]